MQTIPVVNLQDFLKGTPAIREKFVHDMGAALEDIGFFALEGHGVSDGLIGDAYGLAQRFFDLGESSKRAYEDVNVRGQRGFTSFGREHAKNHNAPDLKEFWHVGRELTAEARAYHEKRGEKFLPNVWPTEVSQFKESMLELYRRLDECSMHLLDACALYLGEREGLFSDMARDGNTVLRVIHYPEIPADRHPASVRAAAHEDINFITLLCEATAAGLELLQRDGKWRPVSALKGQIIVDSGDMLQNISNGIFRSTTHRVTNPHNSRERRFSMPFFVHPKSEVALKPLASTIARVGGQKKYPAITAGQYLEERLKEIGLSAAAKSPPAI